MIGYHFFFDLNYFGLAQLDFNNDPFWLGARTFILSLFLGLVGVSLRLFYERGWVWQKYWQRLVWIGVSAIIVSLASWVMFPDSMIFFGVLHFIAMASVLALVFLRGYISNLALGVLIIIAGSTLTHPFFDQPWMQWLGFMTHKPITQDYVPLFPWLGVVLIGLFLGKVLITSPRLGWILDWRNQNQLLRGLAYAGRHSLIIYMIHQPILIAIIYFLLK